MNQVAGHLFGVGARLFANQVGKELLALGSHLFLLGFLEGEEQGRLQTVGGRDLLESL